MLLTPEPLVFDHFFFLLTLQVLFSQDPWPIFYNRLDNKLGQGLATDGGNIHNIAKARNNL